MIRYQILGNSLPTKKKEGEKKKKVWHMDPSCHTGDRLIGSDRSILVVLLYLGSEKKAKKRGRLRSMKSYDSWREICDSCGVRFIGCPDLTLNRSEKYLPISMGRGKLLVGFFFSGLLLILMFTIYDVHLGHNSGNEQSHDRGIPQSHRAVWVLRRSSFLLVLALACLGMNIDLPGQNSETFRFRGGTG